jgi:hypothetical protein
MTVLVEQRNLSGVGLPVTQGDSYRRDFREQFDIVSVGSDYNIHRRRMADNILAQMTGHALGAGVPEQHLAVSVHDIHTGEEAV